MISPKDALTKRCNNWLGGMGSGSKILGGLLNLSCLCPCGITSGCDVLGCEATTLTSPSFLLGKFEAGLFEL